MISMTDPLKYKGMRNLLIKQLEKKGIKDKKVLEAIATVPRQWFMEKGLEEFAYVDKAYPIAAGQTISQPYTVAMQTSLLKIKKGDKVLEIGTGSGYQTAILLEIGAKVVTIERQHELFKKTQLFFEKLPYQPKKMIFGDGYEGYLKEAPFKAILVTAAAPKLPKKLLLQLEIGGRMVIPIGNDKEQKMYLFTRKDQNEFDKKMVGNYLFVPLLKDTNI